jgi:hypothetical protein
VTEPVNQTVNVTGDGFAALSSLTELIESVGGAAKLGGWEAVMQINFTDESAVHLLVSSSGLALRSGTHIKPTVVIRGRGTDLARAFNGEVDMTQLLARGLATSTGRYRDLIELGRLTGAAKKARLAAAAGGTA